MLKNAAGVCMVAPLSPMPAPLEPAPSKDADRDLALTNAKIVQVVWTHLADRDQKSR
jgi:hypothetical protein